jgi:phage terminase large subunit
MQKTIPHNYKPRDYQLPFLAAMDRGTKRAVCVWHRRAGKDKTFLNHCIKRMFERVGTYYYYFPTATMGRKILWDGIDRDGNRFLDHFPADIRDKINEQEMKIKLVNGSVFQVIGTDRLDVVGTNPVGCTFSEYSLQNPKGWEYVRPILAENDGWAVFNFTPRGYNHGKMIYDIANNTEGWFSSLLTVDDTNAISREAIEEERRSGMSEELIMQEFYCSFDMGVEGSYYAKYIARARDENRIQPFNHDKSNRVHTAWDIGVGDSTAIWFYQLSGRQIQLVDYFEAHGEGLPFYVSILEKKAKELGYIYGDHYAPHDIRNREFGTGDSRLEAAKRLGINFRIIPVISIESGIERVRAILDRCYFSGVKCKDGILCLENYRKDFDEKNRAYKDRPLHDWTSHGADAFRYLAQSIKQAERPLQTSYIEQEQYSPI